VPAIHSISGGGQLLNTFVADPLSARASKAGRLRRAVQNLFLERLGLAGREHRAHRRLAVVCPHSPRAEVALASGGNGLD
jgi:hypothetical protein